MRSVPLLLACTALLTPIAGAQPGNPHRPGAPAATPHAAPAPVPHAAPAPVPRAAPVPMPHAAAPVPHPTPLVAAPRVVPQPSPPHVSSAPRVAPSHVERPTPPETIGRSTPNVRRPTPAQRSTTVSTPAPQQPSKQLANRPAPSARTSTPSSTQGLAIRHPQGTAGAEAAARPNITNPQTPALNAPLGATAGVDGGARHRRSL